MSKKKNEERSAKASQRYYDRLRKKLGYTWSDEFEKRIIDILRHVRAYVPDATRDQVIKQFGLDKLDGDVKNIKCCYCHNTLLTAKQTSYPYKEVASIDHMMSHHNGGHSTVENLGLACHRCNIIKGTNNADTYRGILKSLDESHRKNGTNIKQTWFEQSWSAKYADKMNRKIAEQVILQRMKIVENMKKEKEKEKER
jgi:hypothetical protein